MVANSLKRDVKSAFKGNAYFCSLAILIYKHTDMKLAFRKADPSR